MSEAGSSNAGQHPSRKRRAPLVVPDTCRKRLSDVIFVSATPGIKEEPTIKGHVFNIKEEIISEEEEEEDEEEEQEYETVNGLLREWGLDRDLILLFERYRITMDVMQNLNEEDINAMIPNDKLAVRVMLRTHLKKWQRENEYGPFENNEPLSCAVHPRIEIPVCSCKTINRPKKKKPTASPQVLYEEAKKWLETNLYPWYDRHGVVEKWKQTHRYRRTAFMSSELKEHVLTEWPTLCHALGHTLIVSDFDQIYVNKTKCLYKKWDKFYANVMPLFKKNIRDSYSILMYRNLETQPNKEIRDGHVCQLINSILPPSEVIILKLVNEKGRLKTTYWKPSVRDARTSFFNVVVTEQDAREMALSYRIRYQRLNLSWQPLIFGIGFKADYVKRFLIIYNHLQYKVDSFLKALDIVFKLYHVFNLEYNRESYLMWLFIQKYFYDIVTPNDLKSPALDKLMAILK